MCRIPSGRGRSQFSTTSYPLQLSKSMFVLLPPPLPDIHLYKFVWYVSQCFFCTSWLHYVLIYAIFPCLLLCEELDIPGLSLNFRTRIGTFVIVLLYKLYVNNTHPHDKTYCICRHIFFVKETRASESKL